MAAGSIKLFQFIQKLCQLFGIDPPQPNQEQYPLNLINWFTIFCLIQSIISTTRFFLFEANSMVEYGLTFWVCASFITCFNFCLGVYSRAKNIPVFIGNWEKFIEKSKFHITYCSTANQIFLNFILFLFDTGENSKIEYEDLNEKIERSTRLFAYCFFPTGPTITVPAFIYTVVKYFILDSGPESFFLMFPAWSVISYWEILVNWHGFELNKKV